MGDSPPVAVPDCLQKKDGYKNAKVQATTATSARTIVGIADHPGSDNPYSGLDHWIYDRGGTVFSWGEQFTGGDLAGALLDLNTRRNEPTNVVVSIIGI